jgi:hypothetical protein
MLNLNDLRVELLQSEARDLLFVCFQQETAEASLCSAWQVPSSISLLDVKPPIPAHSVRLARAVLSPGARTLCRGACSSNVEAIKLTLSARSSA